MLRYSCSFLLIIFLFSSCRSDEVVKNDWCCANVRVIHLAPTTQPVRIELNYFGTNVKLVDSLVYTQALPEYEYLNLDALAASARNASQRYQFSAFSAGSTSNSPIISSSFLFERQVPYTVVLSDTGLKPSWIPLVDRAPPVGRADTNSFYIRLVNLSNTRDAILGLQNNRRTEPAKPYSASPWLRLPATSMRLEVRDQNQRLVWQDAFERRFLPQRVYQAYFNRDTLLLISDRFR